MTASSTCSSVALTPSAIMQPVQPTPVRRFFFFFCKGGLFVYQLFPLPCLPACHSCRSSGCLCRAEQALRLKSHGAARRVYISTYPPCCNKSVGSHNTHPERTLTCSPTLASETTSCQKNGEEMSGRDTKFTKDLQQMHAGLRDSELHFCLFVLLL